MCANSAKVVISRVAALFAAGLASALVSAASLAPDLTSTEQRWLQGAWPVIAYAKRTHLPLDIVVQPRATPDNAPLSMAFIEGRCKLVLSMRGNPQAQGTLDALEPELLDATLELMAAHELGHCHRYLEGAWFQLPPGFVAGAEAAGPQDTAQRREEGYGDLVGLAWTHAQHPALYERLHSWLLKERQTDRVPGSAHDTVAWLLMARDAAALDQGSLFDAPAPLWSKGASAAVVP